MNDMTASLTTKFSHSIMSRTKAAVKEYSMIKKGDRIAVCISGGKDSMLLACVMRELKLHGGYDFEPVYMVMDPGYAEKPLSQIHHNLDLLGIDAHIFTTDIFAASEGDRNPCALCAKLRRGALYSQAQSLGCNKIALGHHFDDVIETTLMGMVYGGQMQTMMPKLKAKNFEGMELIRPMYLVREKDIINWRDEHGLEFIRCACRFSERAEHDESASRRQLVKRLIADLKKNDPQIEMNIYRSACNVDLSRIISYKDTDGVVRSVMEGFADDADC